MILKEKVKTLLEKKNISVREAEKRSGLNPGIVNNILNGRSKNPRIDTLLAISKTLGCEVRDLLDTTNFDNYSESKLEWDFSLYSKTIQTILEICKKNNLDFSKEVIFNIVDEVYAYSYFKGDKNINKNFAEWVVKNYTN